MYNIKSKDLSTLMTVVFLIFQGCSNNGSTSQIKGLSAQEQPASVAEGSAQAKENMSRLPEFIVGPGDRLEIRVYRNDELTQEVWIGPSGKLMYPLIEDIDAAGLSVFQLRDRIREGLSKYFVNPQVTVRILSIQSQKIIVLGEVQNPGYLLAETSMTILESISRVGGFTNDAEKKSALLVRGGIENPELKVLNLERVLKEGDLTQNVVLQGGDIIYIPRTVISDVSSFFAYLSDIISPIVSAESAYLLGQEIGQGGKTTTSIPLK